MSELVRIVRFLEYIGPREWVEESMERRAVKGVMGLPVLHGGRQIREGLLGEFPEVLDVPLLPCPECECDTFRSPADRDRHLLRCRTSPDDLIEEVVNAACALTNRPSAGTLWRDEITNEDYQRLHSAVIDLESNGYPKEPTT